MNSCSSFVSSLRRQMFLFSFLFVSFSQLKQKRISAVLSSLKSDHGFHIPKKMFDLFSPLRAAVLVCSCSSDLLQDY